MRGLTLEKKDTIRESLRGYCLRYPSKNRASESLKGVSAATVSAILNEKYDSVSDEMWNNIAWQTSMNGDGWQIHGTQSFQELMFNFADAQEFKNVAWVVGDAGCGKTTAAASYRSQHSNVFYILCSEDMHKSDFVRELARQIGLSLEWRNLRELLEQCITYLTELHNPLIIFDEGDKLNDSVFYYFVSIYNRLEFRAGIIFMSTSYIKRRIENGLRYDKKGYREIYSRIGRRFFDLEPAGDTDVHAICKANGVTEDKDIRTVISDAGKSGFDLRRVRKMIHKTVRINELKNKH